MQTYILSNIQHQQQESVIQPGICQILIQSCQKNWHELQTAKALPVNITQITRNLITLHFEIQYITLHKAAA